MFRYSKVKSIACFFNNKKCLVIKVISYIKSGNGFIYYKNYIDKLIINKIKFFIFYFNIFKLNNYDFYFFIKPFNLKKYDNCIDLAIFFSVFLSLFNLNLNNKIFVLGEIDFKNGYLKNIDNLLNKINIFKKFLLNIFIIPKKNKIFKLKFSTLKFNYLFEVFSFFKRCLTQRKE
ncbi:putative DNA repair protein [Candidatus Nasuia deltocephalinicola]|uniref:Putative DNA repair protein n=1 Tax=Candidatus Nasuia deltocephalincola TaxID=1160784 RepID=A0A0S2UP49_9PROT|nr:putative DNA repair protein [Candidatus Nasuia deltocephalinicola]